jgi:hypothetical protein
MEIPKELAQIREDLHELVDELFKDKHALDENVQESIVMYRSWDIGDCSSVGLVRILMINTIKEYQKDCYIESGFENILHYLETEYRS